MTCGREGEYDSREDVWMEGWKRLKDVEGGNGMLVSGVKRLWRGKAKEMDAKSAVVVRCCRFGFMFGFMCASGTACSSCSVRRFADLVATSE